MVLGLFAGRAIKKIGGGISIGVDFVAHFTTTWR